MRNTRGTGSDSLVPVQRLFLLLGAVGQMITSCFLSYPGLWFLFFLSSFFLSCLSIHIVSCRLLSDRLRCPVVSCSSSPVAQFCFLSFSHRVFYFLSSGFIISSASGCSCALFFLSFKNSQNIRLLLTFLSRPVSSLMSIVSLATLASR